MRKIWPAVVIGVMVIGLSGGPASAQHRPMLGEMDRGPGLFMLLFKGAALTPDQETHVRAILAAHRANARDLMRQLRAAREGIVDKLVAPGAVAAGDLEPLRQQIIQLEEQLSQDRLPPRPGYLRPLLPLTPAHAPHYTSPHSRRAA